MRDLLLTMTHKGVQHDGNKSAPFPMSNLANPFANKNILLNGIEELFMITKEVKQEKDMASTGLVPSPAPGVRRIAINISEQAYNDLRNSAESTARSMTDVIRIGIGLFKVAAEVMREGNKLVVVSRTGTPLREIVLPS